MSLVKDLEYNIKQWGASFIGYSNVSENLPASLSELGFAITLGVNLSDFIIDQIEDRPTYTYFHHYRTVNTLIDQIALRTTLFLQDRGYRALAVPASQTVNDADDAYCGIFPHKTAAVKSGLGWIGKNDLFISNHHGPRVRLGTVLTDLELPVENKIMESKCGDCKKCVENCPAMALTGNKWEIGCPRSHIVDAKACSEYMNANYKHIGRGSVCGICIRVCPWGKLKRSSG
ncbi:MAG TPA: epoxyqueuosine reductase [Clostridiaceae bacterium]|nr:epoxyqueuosine reductase [Clostridiaceae bacterium]